jgi:hypothetical protein
LYALASVSPSELIAVGARGTILKIAQVDGEDVVSVVASPVLADLYGVAVGPSGALACGRGGTLVAIGDTVALVASNTTADLKAVTRRPPVVKLTTPVRRPSRYLVIPQKSVVHPGRKSPEGI